MTTKKTKGKKTKGKKTPAKGYGQRVKAGGDRRPISREDFKTEVDRTAERINKFLDERRKK